MAKPKPHQTWGLEVPASWGPKANTHLALNSEECPLHMTALSFLPTLWVWEAIYL